MSFRNDIPGVQQHKEVQLFSHLRDLVTFNGTDKKKTAEIAVATSTAHFMHIKWIKALSLTYLSPILKGLHLQPDAYLPWAVQAVHCQPVWPHGTVTS